MAKRSLIEAVNEALHVAMKHDKDVVVLGEDVGKLGGVFRATARLQQEFGVERVIDTPLAEAGIVGASIGMAMYGLKPVAEIQFMGFDFMACNQLMAHAGRLRNRTRGRFTVPLVIRMPCGGGIHAPEHHSESTEAMYAHTPGLKVVMPSTPYDTKGLLLAAIADPDPVIFLEHKRIYRAVKGEVPDDYYTVPIGEAAVVRDGSDATIVSWGFMRHLAERAAELAAAEGVSVEVIDLRTISPWDEATVLASVEKTGRLIVLHEAQKQCGVGAEIAAVAAERAMFALKGPIQRVTGFDINIPLAQGETMYLPSEARLMAAVRKAMEY